MLSRVLGAMFALGSLASWFCRKSIEALFFEHVARMVQPLENWAVEYGWAIEYGPPAVFALLALWLLGAHKHAARLIPSRNASPTITPAATVQGGAPELSLSFAEEIPGCRVSTHFNNNIPATFYRVKVRNDAGETHCQCRGRVVGIQKKNIVGVFEEYGFAEQLQLTWGVHGISGPPLTIDIPNQQEEFLDILYVTPLGNVGLATQGFVAPNSMPRPFADEGEYLLTINVTSEKSFQAIQLVFGIVVVPNKPQHEVVARMRQL